jgi:hypothetical protein
MQGLELELEKLFLVGDGKVIREKNCQSYDTMLQVSRRGERGLEAQEIFSCCAMIDVVGGGGEMGNGMGLVDGH